MKTATTTVAPRSLMGAMSRSERLMGRFMRNPDEHTPAPPMTPPVEEVAAPVAPPVEAPPVETPPAPQISDGDAKLVKEVMKHKNAARETQAALEVANAKLAAYGDATPEEIAQYRADRAAAELAAAEARGEYDRIIEQVRAQADATKAEFDARIAEAEAKLAEKSAKIDELTVGRAFGDSKFLSEDTVLTPSKARRLYGDHVEMVDGEIVVYDKPKGAKERTPLVDGNGKYLSFEAGIEKVIRADPDFETIGRSKVKSGSGSTPSAVIKEDPKPVTASGVGRIAAGLNARNGK